MSYDQRRILCEEGSYRTQYPVLTFSQGYLTSLGVILGQRWEHRDMAYAFDCQRTVETFAQQAQSILQQVDEAYPEPANPAPPATFPAFVVRGFLENLLRQNTNCPIAMEPLTRDSVCMTPCFHAFSKDSVVPWIEEQQSCPVCRHPCTLVQLWNLDP
jgi:hypothetical protein